MKMVIGLLQLREDVRLTVGFQKEYETAIDLRNEFNPKKLLQEGEGYLFNFQQYSQTFGEKFDFVPDLSIVDLLFNSGPASETILLQNLLKEWL